MVWRATWSARRGAASTLNRCCLEMIIRSHLGETVWPPYLLPSLIYHVYFSCSGPVSCILTSLALRVVFTEVTLLKSIILFLLSAGAPQGVLTFLSRLYLLTPVLLSCPHPHTPAPPCPLTQDRPLMSFSWHPLPVAVSGVQAKCRLLGRLLLDYKVRSS